MCPQAEAVAQERVRAAAPGRAAPTPAPGPTPGDGAGRAQGAGWAAGPGAGPTLGPLPWDTGTSRCVTACPALRTHRGELGSGGEVKGEKPSCFV